MRRQWIVAGLPDPPTCGACGWDLGDGDVCSNPDCDGDERYLPFNDPDWQRDFREDR